MPFLNGINKILHAIFIDMILLTKQIFEEEKKTDVPSNSYFVYFGEKKKTLDFVNIVFINPDIYSIVQLPKNENKIVFPCFYLMTTLNRSYVPGKFLLCNHESYFLLFILTNLNIFKVLLIWSPLLNARAPSVEILLLLKSKSVNVLFSLRDSPTAAAPSLANPFQDRSNVCRLQLARSPLPIAIPPLPRRWFQLRLRYSSPPLASMAGPKI